MESEMESTTYYPTLKSARNAANKKRIQDQWIKQWNEGTETAVKLRAMRKQLHFTAEEYCMLKSQSNNMLHGWCGYAQHIAH
jgi:hypothetical protein